MGVLDALFDPQFRKDVVRGALDAVNRGAVAGTLGGPVDLATMALRPLGYTEEKPVMGSEWIGDKLRRLGLVTDNRNPVAEALASVAIPGALSRAAPAVFAAEQRAAQNMMQQSPMNAATRGQAGAIVWHGSPHKFDKFDSSKIGTGEGAQAYGHGLYLAENEAVSKGYMRAGETAAPIQFNGEGIMNWALGNRDKVAAMPKVTQQSLAFARDFSSIDEAARMARMNDMPSVEGELRRLAAGGLLKDSPPGNLYKVDLPDDQMARMLDWDKPLSQQAPEVQKGLAALDPDMYGPKGGDYDPMELGQMIYQRLMNQGRDYAITAGKNAQTTLGASQAKAAEDLRAFGIPGIRYLDGGSRGAGTGTRNYVVFPGEEDILQILERNGAPITGGGR